MNQLLTAGNSSIRSSSKSKGDQKAIYRFLSNEKVSEQELIECCIARTGSLCKGKDILVLNDSTEINLQSHAGRLNHESGIGLVGNNHDVGFFIHAGLAVDAEYGQALGFSHINLWHRSKNKGTKETRQYKQLAVEEKESYKWIQCAIQSKELLQDAARVTVVGDRESDMYELFADALACDINVVARSRVNRKTSEGYLYDLSEKPVLGEYQIQLQGDLRKQTLKRTAKLEVKSSEVSLQKPRISSPGRPDSVNVWLVQALERNRPNGIAWRLLTTHPVNTYQDAMQIINWYKMRWQMEEVFRLLKSKGYRIEESQLENGLAVRKLTIMILHTILRVIQMSLAYGKVSPEQNTVFTEDEVLCLKFVNQQEEGKTEKLKNNHPAGSLQWITWIIARLGGWSGYQSERKPGPITLKNGVDRFNFIYIGWLMAINVGTQ